MSIFSAVGKATATSSTTVVASRNDCSKCQREKFCDENECFPAKSGAIIGLLFGWVNATVAMLANHLREPKKPLQTIASGGSQNSHHLLSQDRVTRSAKSP